MIKFEVQNPALDSLSPPEARGKRIILMRQLLQSSSSQRRIFEKAIPNE